MRRTKNIMLFAPICSFCFKPQKIPSHVWHIDIHICSTRFNNISRRLTQYQTSDAAFSSGALAASARSVLCEKHLLSFSQIYKHRGRAKVHCVYITHACVYVCEFSVAQGYREGHVCVMTAHGGTVLFFVDLPDV
jgi:hypothetical protein